MFYWTRNGFLSALETQNTESWEKFHPSFLSSELPWWLFVSEKEATAGETWNSVLWLGKDGLYSLPLHALQNPCWNVVLVLCC